MCCALLCCAAAPPLPRLAAKRSTFRHDLKIKTSDEGRVMKTAAAFAKGFLELEGDLTPILVSLVSKESSKNSSVMMLDPSGNKDITKDMDRRYFFFFLS